jgi:hypothetical protein
MTVSNLCQLLGQEIQEIKLVPDFNSLMLSNLNIMQVVYFLDAHNITLLPLDAISG